VDLGAQGSEGLVLVGEYQGLVSHAGRGGLVAARQRQQADRLSQPGEALRGEPLRVGQHRQHQRPGSGLLVLDL
jgi:hypothetical protein